MKNSVFITMLVLLVGCKAPNIIVSPELKSNTSVFDVKGRQGWQFNQVITYGDYSSSKIKRGWTSKLEIPFVVKFSNAHEKLSFTQFTADKQQADVYAVGRLEQADLPLLNGFLNYSINYRNTFVGTIIPIDVSGDYWDFLIYNMESGISNDVICGSAKDTKGNEIIIKGVSRIEGQGSLMQAEFVGFEFFMNGQSVGAVSCFNNGKVWMKDDLNPDIKLVISSISTSLLVKHNLTDNHSRSLIHMVNNSKRF
jgi:hypothetical protein